MNRPTKIMLALVGLSALACAGPNQTPDPQAQERQLTDEEAEWSNEGRAISTAKLRAGSATSAARDAIPRPPDPRYEAGGFAVVVEELKIDEERDFLTVDYVLANISPHEIDYIEVDVTPLDRAGEPVPLFDGRTTRTLVVERNMQPRTSRGFIVDFRDWNNPIKTVRITTSTITFANGEKSDCSVEEHKRCSWEVSRD